MKHLLMVAVLAAVAQPASYYVTIAGLGGEPDYEQRFAAQAAEAEKLLKPGGEVHTLTGAGATKAKIREVLEAIGRKAGTDDSLVLFLIGHGTYDGSEYKFNLPGADVAATELASLLDRVKASRQLVVNATSASGASIVALQRPGRVVVAATKAGTEKNATVFARYWLEALREASADTDKNETISALEAFKYAELKTKQFYETNKRLATEHPMLDGDTAARFAVLRLGETQKAAADPAKRALFATREELENRIEDLKLKKAAMPAAEYKQQLQALLLELARTQAELDK